MLPTVTDLRYIFSKSMRTLLFSLLIPLLAQVVQTSDFYLREEIPLPLGEVMEIGSIALMPEQKFAVATRRGDLWIVLRLTGSSDAAADWRGWAVRVTPDGKMIPTASGIRSPGDIGFNASGDVFYTDNQGLWNGSSSLKWLKPGSFQGNPTGNKFHQLAKLPAPPAVTDKSRVLAERTKFPDYIPPAVVLPHAKIGQSPTGIACDQSGGKFGPWKNQLYIGEQTHSQVQRVCQERVKWTGKVPFEIQTMTANKDGFSLNFTESVDPATAGNPASYAMKAWTYILQSDYGSPEVDPATPKITAATVSADRKSVRLKIDGLVRGHVHHLSSKGVTSANGQALWHPDAYYTLNEIP